MAASICEPINQRQAVSSRPLGCLCSYTTLSGPSQDQYAQQEKICPKIGSVVYHLPYHICSTCSRSILKCTYPLSCQTRIKRIHGNTCSAFIATPGRTAPKSTEQSPGAMARLPSTHQNQSTSNHIKPYQAIAAIVLIPKNQPWAITAHRKTCSKQSIVSTISLPNQSIPARLASERWSFSLLNRLCLQLKLENR